MSILLVIAVFVFAASAYYYYVRIPAAEKGQNAATDSSYSPVTFAFFGDQGKGEGSRSVLQLVQNEGADAVVHVGDFDYANNPEAWDNQISAYLGETFRYLSVVGNHDLMAWDGYQQKIADRIARLADVHCTGAIGTDFTCVYGPVTIIFSAVGTMDGDHTTYLDSALDAATTPWVICAWHKNQHDLQTGEKTDEVGWDAYNICRQHGAFIITGHEHSYARTYLLGGFDPEVVANTSDTLMLQPGFTAVAVAGLGGHSVRVGQPDLVASPWWATTYNKNNDAVPGALFCRFADSGTDHASCYFKDIQNVVRDRFQLTTQQ